MKPCYLYLRTSGDDGRTKAGIPVQREACTSFAAGKCDIQQEFVDDGISGKLPMSARPAGKQLIAALLSSNVKTIVSYDAKRIGRTQPAFWSFIGFCRDSGATVLDANGTDLGGSVMGGVNGMLAEMDRDQTIARLSAGKAIARRAGRRVDGCAPFGQHPSVAYAHERTVVAQILQWRKENLSLYRIALELNAVGAVTRSGAKFRIHMIERILGGSHEVQTNRCSV